MRDSPAQKIEHALSAAVTNEFSDWGGNGFAAEEGDTFPPHPARINAAPSATESEITLSLLLRASTEDLLRFARRVRILDLGVSLPSFLNR
jgi:hypothetical protein